MGVGLPPAHKPRLLRALVLHGKGGNQESQARKFSPLVSAFAGQVDFSFLQAPHAMPVRELSFKGQREPGYQWWSLEAGQRSFTATEFEGVESSIQLVTDTLCSGILPRDLDGNDSVGVCKEGTAEASAGSGFDIIWGHSQGAILVSILLSRLFNGGWERKHRHHHKFPRLAILNGATFPRPFVGELERTRTLTCAQLDSSRDNGPSRTPTSTSPYPRSTAAENNILPLLTHSLHTFDVSDPINPASSAREVSGVFGPYARTMTHSSGHNVPMDASAIAEYRNFFALAFR